MEWVPLQLPLSHVPPSTTLLYSPYARYTTQILNRRFYRIKGRTVSIITFRLELSAETNCTRFFVHKDKRRMMVTYMQLRPQ